MLKIWVRFSKHSLKDYSEGIYQNLCNVLFLLVKWFCKLVRMLFYLYCVPTSPFTQNMLSCNRFRFFTLIVFCIFNLISLCYFLHKYLSRIIYMILLCTLECILFMYCWESYICLQYDLFVHSFNPSIRFKRVKIQLVLE